MQGKRYKTYKGGIATIQKAMEMKKEPFAEGPKVKSTNSTLL
jgi:hypothetical protein